MEMMFELINRLDQIAYWQSYWSIVTENFFVLRQILKKYSWKNDRHVQFVGGFYSYLQQNEKKLLLCHYIWVWYLRKTDTKQRQALCLDFKGLLPVEPLEKVPLFWMTEADGEEKFCFKIDKTLCYNIEVV